MSGLPEGGYVRAEPWLILLALAGLVVVTLSGQGSYKPFVYLTELLVLVHLARHVLHKCPVRPAAGWLVLAPAAFIVCDVLTPNGDSEKYAVQNLIAFVAIAGAVWILPGRWPEVRRLYTLMVTVLAAIATAHAVTLWFNLEPHGPMDNPGLLSHNPHFLSLQAAVVGTVMVHALLGGGLARWIALVGMTAVATSLVLLESVLGTLSLFVAGVGVAAVHLPRGPRLAVGAVAAGVLLLVLIYPAMPGSFEAPLGWIQQVVGASRLDQRFDLWADSWRLQQQSSLVQWLLGHGLGGYEARFWQVWTFPHHFGLEVLFNSGLVGLLTLAAVLAALGAAMAKHLQPGPGRLLLAFALLLSVGVFTFLTLPLTGRVTAHALGVAVGLSMWALKQDAAGEG